MPCARIRSNSGRGSPSSTCTVQRVGAGLGEVVEQVARVVDHQVAVEVQVGVRAQALHHRRADREVRHEVAVHHVDVQEVGLRPDAARPRRRARRSRRRGSTVRSFPSRRPTAGRPAERVSDEDEHAVGAGDLREQQRAPPPRPPRRARRRLGDEVRAAPSRAHSSTSIVSARRERAHRVDEPAARPHQSAAALASSSRWSAGELGDRVRLDPPAGLGPAAQHARSPEHGASTSTRSKAPRSRAAARRPSAATGADRRRGRAAPRPGA